MEKGTPGRDVDVGQVDEQLDAVDDHKAPGTARDEPVEGAHPADVRRERESDGLRAAALAGDGSLELSILAGISSLLVRTGRHERAAEGAAAVLHYLAGTWATQARAERLLGELASHLPPETLAQAQAHAVTLDVDTIAAQLVEEL
jgi:hypothetical protein